MNSLSIISEKVDRHLIGKQVDDIGTSSVDYGPERAPKMNRVWAILCLIVAWAIQLWKAAFSIHVYHGSSVSKAESSSSQESTSHIRLYDQDVAIHDSIKSPTSPSINFKIPEYAPAPPPLKPLLQKHQRRKTLILDLDETLIHSLAKGGKMSSGHMVEVKLQKHAILYYVHKRPYCDEFLRMVSGWYHVVIFTASVQEYADPVIDWLEQDRKYFKARYYRHHCTLRNGVYIKDISLVEADPNRAIILDNSPSSYILHEENAIPIEGWINDPSDYELLHLIPVLHAMQYLPDVRGFLTLRLGQDAIR